MRILVSGSTAVVRDVAGKYPGTVGHLLTPRNGNSCKATAATGLPWAVDNGAFTGFEPGRFRRKVAAAAGKPGLLWVVVPDVVADAPATLESWRFWRPVLAAEGVPLAFVAQDGQEAYGLPWDEFACLSLGGSTWWKLSRHALALAGQARGRGKLVHMGRVNTLRRLRTAYSWGCDTVDGSCFSRWGRKFLLWAVKFVGRLKQQPVLF